MSNQATATTGPAAPTAISATTASANEIDLHWTASASSDVDSYNIYASVDGVQFDAIDSVPADQTSYPVTGLPPGADVYILCHGDEGRHGRIGRLKPGFGDDAACPADGLVGDGLAFGRGGFVVGGSVVRHGGDDRPYLQRRRKFHSIGGSRGRHDFLCGDRSRSGSDLHVHGHRRLRRMAHRPAQIRSRRRRSRRNWPSSGSGMVNEDDEYTLALSSTPADGLSAPIVSWEVDWHDASGGSSDLETVEGDSGSTLGHVFPAGYQGGNVSVTAIDGDGNRFMLPDTSVSVIPAAPSGLETTVFGRNQIDLTGRITAMRPTALRFFVRMTAERRSTKSVRSMRARALSAMSGSIRPARINTGSLQREGRMGRQAQRRPLRNQLPPRRVTLTTWS